MKTRMRAGAVLEFQGSGFGPQRLSPAATVLALLLAAGGPAATGRAETIYWDGGNGNWTDSTRWSTNPSATTPDPGAAPGASDDVVFNISISNATSTVSLNGHQAVNAITLSTNLTAGPVIQGGGVNRTLTLGAGGITAVPASFNWSLGSATANQNVNVALNGSQEWVWRPSNIVTFNVRNKISRTASDTADRTLVLNSGGASAGIAVSDTVSDGGSSGSLSVWKRGAGSTTFNVSNALSGAVTVQEGTLTIANANGLGTATLQLAGGTIAFSSATPYTPNAVSVIGGSTRLGSTVAATVNWGTISRTAGAGIFARPPADVATNYVANVLVNGIVGPWALWPVDASNWDYATTVGGILTQATTTTITTINDLTAGTGGTGNFRTTANLGGGNAALSASRSANTFYSGSMPSWTLGNYDLRLNGFGTGNFNNSINGGGTGKLLIGDSDELVVSTGNGGVTLNANVGELSAGGRLTLAPYGTGFMKLAGTNTHSGGTSIHKNTLNLNGPFVLGSGPFTISGGNLDNSSAADLTLANNNAQVWNTDFTYVGTRGLNMGTGAVSLGSYPGAKRTVTVTANTLTIGGAISDGTHAHLPTKSLTKTGAGTLELTGASTYSGATTVSAGTLALGASASLASTNIAVAAGATLQLAGSASLADTATLTLDGVANPAGGVKERVGALYLGGVAQAAKKTYGSTASAAMVTSDTYFTPGSTGVIEVGVVPAAGTVVVVR